MNDWQTWAALGVVAVTILLFIRRALHGGKGCGGDCGCNQEGKAPPAPPRRPSA